MRLFLLFVLTAGFNLPEVWYFWAVTIWIATNSLKLLLLSLK